MADRHTLDNWGERLNVKDEPLTMEEAMLLSLGHQNARLELMLVALQDMQMRTQRMELWLAAHFREYDQQTRALAAALAEARNGSGER